MATKTRTSTSTTNKKWGTANNWEASGIPAIGDDVVLLGTAPESDSTEIAILASCRSLDAQNYKKTLTHKTGISLQIGTSTNSATETSAGVFLALRLPTVASGGKYEFESASEITFKSTSGSVQSIFTNGQKLPKCIYKAPLGKWRLEDENNAATIVLESGELNTNGQTCKWTAFSTFEATQVTRSLVAGTSTIELTGFPSTGDEGSALSVWEEQETQEKFTPSVASAKIVVTDTGANFKIFDARKSNPSIGTFTCSGNNVRFRGGCTIGTLNVNTARAVKAVKGTLVNGSTTLTVTEGFPELSIGMEISGPSIPVGTTLVKVISEVGKTWEMTKAATGTVSTAEAVEAFPVGFRLEASKTQTVTTLTTNGKSTEPARLVSDTAGTQAKIKLPAGKYVIENARLRDINIEGTTEFYAPTTKGCVDCGGNSASIKFEDPPRNVVAMML